MPGKRHIHTTKFRRCVQKVSKTRGYNPYAVCAASIGYKGSMVQKKVHGMPLNVIEKMVKSKKTPMRLKAFWKKKLNEAM